MKHVKSSDLEQFSSLTKVQISNIDFTEAQPPHLANKNSLTFVSTAEMFVVAEKNGACGFVVLAKALEEVKPHIKSNFSVWSTPQINYAMSEVLNLFDKKKPTPVNETTIHPSAIVHPSAQIGKNVFIGANTVVEENTVIGDNSYIDALVCIKKNVQIGNSTHIASHVAIGAFCKVGNNCNISSNVTIGSDGFGYYSDKQNSHHKVPQVGIVVIEDKCDIGSHCAIDRATLTETRIKQGSKLDNFCHIAHNSELGENAMVAAGFMVAGSTKIGKNLVSSGGVHVNGHITVADNVVLTARTGVVSSIKESGFYGGFPELPHKENIRVMMSMSSLPKIRRQVSKILKHLGISED